MSYREWNAFVPFEYFGLHANVCFKISSIFDKEENSNCIRLYLYQFQFSICSSADEEFLILYEQFLWHFVYFAFSNYKSFKLKVWTIIIISCLNNRQNCLLHFMHK